MEEGKHVYMGNQAKIKDLEQKKIKEIEQKLEDMDKLMHSALENLSNKLKASEINTQNILRQQGNNGAANTGPVTSSNGDAME